MANYPIILDLLPDFPVKDMTKEWDNQLESLRKQIEEGMSPLIQISRGEVPNCSDLGLKDLCQIINFPRGSPIWEENWEKVKLIQCHVACLAWRSLRNKEFEDSLFYCGYLDFSYNSVVNFIQALIKLQRFSDSLEDIQMHLKNTGDLRSSFVPVLHGVNPLIILAGVISHKSRKDIDVQVFPLSQILHLLYQQSNEMEKHKKFEKIIPTLPIELKDFFHLLGASHNPQLSGSPSLPIEEILTKAEEYWSKNVEFVRDGVCWRFLIESISRPIARL